VAGFFFDRKKAQSVKAPSRYFVIIPLASGHNSITQRAAKMAAFSLPSRQSGCFSPASALFWTCDQEVFENKPTFTAVQWTAAT
jgi:hypothetical protein